jgi:hypothetical protein
VLTNTDPKINEFYLQREAALKLRLETLLSKRRAAAMRGLPDTLNDITQDHVEWRAVEEGFRLLERDLGKLQVCIRVTQIFVIISAACFSNSSRSMRRVFEKY